MSPAAGAGAVAAAVDGHGHDHGPTNPHSARSDGHSRRKTSSGRTNRLSDSGPSSSSASSPKQPSSPRAATRRPSFQSRTMSTPAPPRGSEPVKPARSSTGAVRKNHEYTGSVSSITSFSSISNDPFFRSYQTPDSLRLAGAIASGSPIALSRAAQTTSSGPRARRHPVASALPSIPLPSVTIEEESEDDDDSADDDMPDINIAVVGATGVGKSTFIHQALGLRQSTISQVSARKMSLDGIIHIVRLFECNTAGVDPKDSHQLPWSDLVRGLEEIRIDGALVLYDVMNHHSLAAVPDVLGALSDAAIPSVLVSCKCDVSAPARQLDAEIIERAGASLGRVEALQTAANSPESQKRCMGAILGRVMAERNGLEPAASSRPRANSDAPTVRTRSKSPPVPRKAKHGRSTSEMSASRQKRSSSSSHGPGPSGANARAARTHSRAPGNLPSPTTTVAPSQRSGGSTTAGKNNHSTAATAAATATATATATAAAAASKGQRHSHGSQRQSYTRSSTAPSTSSSQRSSHSLSNNNHHHHHKSRRSSTSKGSDVSPRSTLTKSPAQVFAPKLSVVSDVPLRPRRSSTKQSPVQPQVVESFLIMDDDNDNDDYGHSSDDIPILDREDDEKSERPAPNTGYTLEALVDRLLSQPLSKSDANFAAIFLCLYRKFAAPAELLDVLVSRFEELEQEENQHMIRISSQLRHLSIMSQWVMGYPGDFAHPHTRYRLNRFIASLAHNRAFAVAAKEMRSQLEVVTEDEDHIWARSDPDHGKFASMDAAFGHGSVNSTATTLPAGCAAEDSPQGKDGGVGTTEEDGGNSTRTSGATSSSSSGANSTHWSAASFQTLLNSAQSAEREAQRLVPTPRTPLTKIQWHQFMEMIEDEIAEEMTRIDWIMFSSIRPRDLIRHVSLSASQKENCKSLENVNRMIAHFNHVAYWVSNMIILRDKPKHRAKALEKFMAIAWKLRQTNNYNSLGAVIAGINANAIHRLSQTRELVSPQAQKDFMRLEILMGTQKSHFAYRLAWENTSSGRIPFLPLHRRDLVSAEEGNRTFIGEGEKWINWKKFEIMGDVIVGIQRSQGTPYLELERSPEAQRLVLDGELMKDDEELYERSIQLEPPGVVTVDNSRKKFAWFQR